LKNRYLRLFSTGAKSSFSSSVPGYLDNVRRDARGGYWVALNQERRHGST